jgi:transposase
MAPPNKLSTSQIRDLREAYEAWDASGTISADELAAEHGISKQTMYKLRRNGWNYAGDGKYREPGDTALEELQAVVRYLTNELVVARNRIAELEA